MLQIHPSGATIRYQLFFKLTNYFTRVNYRKLIKSIASLFLVKIKKKSNIFSKKNSWR